MIGDDFFLQRMGLPRWHSCDVFGRAPLEFFCAFPGFCVALLWCFAFDILRVSLPKNGISTYIKKYLISTNDLQ